MRIARRSRITVRSRGALPIIDIMAESDLREYEVRSTERRSRSGFVSAASSCFGELNLCWLNPCSLPVVARLGQARSRLTGIDAAQSRMSQVPNTPRRHMPPARSATTLTTSSTSSMMKLHQGL